MKKLIASVFFLVLISCASMAVDLGNGGFMFFAPNNISQTITSGSAGLTWNEDFSSSTLATETWGTNISVGKSKIYLAGDGYLKIEPGGPVSNYNNDFNPQGIFRTIAGDFTAVVKFAFAPTETYQTAGIAVANGGGQYWASLVKSYNGSQVIGRRDTINNISYDGSFSGFSESSSIYMKAVRSGTNISLYYGTNGSAWTEATVGTQYHPAASDSVILWIDAIHTTDGGIATMTVDYCNITRP